MKLILTNAYVIRTEVERVLPQNLELFKNLKELEIIDESNYRRTFGIYLSFYRNFRSIECLKIDSSDRNIKIFLQEFLPVMSSLKEISIISFDLYKENGIKFVKNLVPYVKKLKILSNRGDIVPKITRI